MSQIRGQIPGLVAARSTGHVVRCSPYLAGLGLPQCSSLLEEPSGEACPRQREHRHGRGGDGVPGVVLRVVCLAPFHSQRSLRGQVCHHPHFMHGEAEAREPLELALRHPTSEWRSCCLNSAGLVPEPLLTPGVVGASYFLPTPIRPAALPHCQAPLGQQDVTPAVLVFDFGVGRGVEVEGALTSGGVRDP